MESHTCWAETAQHEQFSVDCFPSFPTPNTVLKEWGGVEGGMPLCNLQVCHLVASFCRVSSKGFSWHQDGALALHEPDQEGCRNGSIRPPHLSYLCNWGWTNRSQQAALAPLLADLGLQYLSVSAVGVLQYSCGLQEETNFSVSLVRPRLPLQRQCPYMPPKSSHTK